MFFQLLKTTPYLSGQHRLDVCLHKEKLKETHRNSWDIITSDCHLSPLSDGISFTDSIERPFFNQTYGENLKFLYAQLKDDFFRDVPSIKATNILYEDDIWIDTTDHTYECGLKRMRYEKYHKQFSWLCPLWIEDEYVIDSLYFIMTIYGDNAERHSMKLKITPSNELKASLKEWLKGISSDLLYIDIDNETATIKGARADMGTTVTADVSYIVPQLFERERPVMETNSALNQLFSSNCMIAKQLINFNFCFSPEDVIPSHMINEFIGMRWKITLDAYYNDEMIDKKDFLSNYEFLPSYIVRNGAGRYTTSHNVLDYFEDNKYIDYMYVNKTTQVDPYWALVENPNYIYNFYNGFSSWYTYPNPDNGRDNDSQVMGLTQVQPDTEHIEYSYQYNNLGWCEIYDYSIYQGWNTNTQDYRDLVPRMRQIYNDTGIATEIKIDPSKVCWINGLKFDCTNMEVPLSLNFKMFICLTGDDCSFQPGASEIEPGVYCLFVPTGGSQPNRWKNKLTVRSLTGDYPIIGPFNGSNIAQNIQLFFQYVFPTLVFPTKIVYRKSILPVPAECTMLNTKEITYIKQEYNVKSHIFRYSGALRPCFISPDDMNFFNIDYNFKKWTKSDRNAIIGSPVYTALKEYNAQLNSGYQPVFPSIGFYAIEGGFPYQNGELVDHTALPRRIDYFTYPQRYNNIECEFPWYEDGRLYVMPHTIEHTFIKDFSGLQKKTLEKEYFISELKNILERRYGIDNPETKSQLANLYDFTVDYDYINDRDINNYKFKVKYILR